MHRKKQVKDFTIFQNQQGSVQENSAQAAQLDSNGYVQQEFVQLDALNDPASCTYDVCASAQAAAHSAAAAQAAQQGAEVAKASAQSFAQQSANSAQQSEGSAQSAANSAAAAQKAARSLQPKCEDKLSTLMKSEFQVYSSVIKSSLAGNSQTDIRNAIDAADKALSNFMTNLKFSKFQVADVSTSNNCSTSATCNVSSKSPQTVYDSQGMNFSFGTGDYLKLIAASSAIPTYQLTRYNSEDVAQSNPVPGKITNINCDYALFEGSNGKKTLFALQSTISDGGALSFIGTNNPTTAEITSYARTGSLEPLSFGGPNNLYDLKFGYGQVKVNIGPAYSIPVGCSSTPPIKNECQIEATAANIAYANLQDGKYVQLSASRDALYPYTVKLFNKNGSFASNKGNVKLDNMNDDYAIISNAGGSHALLSLKKLLPTVTDNSKIEKFTGVAKADLTDDYIASKAAGGSTTSLVWGNFLNTKFNPKQAGDTDYQPSCLHDTKCVIDELKIASLAGSVWHDFAIFDHDYLKFYQNSNGSYALKLHSGADDSVMRVVSNSGNIVNGNNNYFLFVDNSNQAGILFRLDANFVGRPGERLLGSDNIKTGLTASIHPQGYFVGELNPSSDDLDMLSINDLLGLHSL